MKGQSVTLNRRLASLIENIWTWFCLILIVLFLIGMALNPFSLIRPEVLAAILAFTILETLVKLFQDKKSYWKAACMIPVAGSLAYYLTPHWSPGWAIAGAAIGNICALVLQGVAFDGSTEG